MKIILLLAVLLVACPRETNDKNIYRGDEDYYKVEYVCGEAGCPPAGSGEWETEKQAYASLRIVQGNHYAHVGFRWRVHKNNGESGKWRR